MKDVNYLEVAQYLRFHMVPVGKSAAVGEAKPRRQLRAAEPVDPLVAKIKEIGRPYEGFCLIIDCETTTFDGQSVRFGTYQIRGIPSERRLELAKRGKLTRTDLDTVQERGLFYAGESLAPTDIERLRIYAANNKMTIMTRVEFIRDVLVGTGRYQREYWRHGGLIIGFNLVFDIGAIATDFWLAQGEFHGGFGFKMCDCGGTARKHCAFHPGIRVKPIAPRKHILEWCVTQIPTQCRGSRDWDRYNKRRTELLDVSQFARALLGPDGGGSLEDLCEALNTETRKVSRKDHGAPITDEYIDYAVRDVQATWEVYTRLRETYRQHGLSRPMWKVYSEASVGKGLLAELGMPKFMEQHSYIPHEITAKFMAGYYGGLSAVGIRLSPREIMHCDFKSQYSTVNSLMRLQDLLLAEKIELCFNSEEARRFLETVTLYDLQKLKIWPKLRGVAKVKPANDILPGRIECSGEKGLTNIALCDIQSASPTYYAFADLVASKLKTGKCPEILETIELIPHGRVATRPWKLFGNDRYTIDLSTDDLFARLIDLRTEIKDMADSGPEAQKPYLNMLQKALKLLASATSYGILVEYVDEERAELRSCDVFRSDKETGERHRTQKLESPGTYFAGPVGVLIPAAGRLLLAIADRLGIDRGIRYVFCDTDSMCYARPDNLDFKTFSERVNEIVEWFTPLSPYKAPGSIFQKEVAEPGWYCLAESAKRYAIYRHGHKPMGEAAIIFKAGKLSSHGMGAIRDPAGYKSIYPDAPVGDALADLVTSKAAAGVIYDIWREAIAALEAGKEIPRKRPYLRGFPYFNRAVIGNAHQARLYQSLANARPFTFFSAVPQMVAEGGSLIVFNPERRKRLELLSGTSMYAPHTKDFHEIAGQLHFRDDGTPVLITDEDLEYLRFQTLEDRLERYFDHPEHKAFPPAGIGQLKLRNVVLTHTLYMGKETVPEDEFTEFADRDLRLDIHREPLILGKQTRRAASGQKFDASLVERLRSAPLRELARKTGISRDALIRYRREGKAPDQERRTAILAALEALDQAATADNTRAKRTAQLRGRIKSLSSGMTEISGITRVRKAVAGQINRSCFQAFMFRDQTPSPADLDLIATTVARLEQEDFPVGPASIKGTVTRVRYLDQTTGFAVFDVLSDDGDMSTTIKGKSSRYLGAGMRAVINGIWQYHEEFGQQVEGQTISLSLPTEEPDIKRYLASGAIPGVGAVLSGRLVRQLGANVFRVAEDEPEQWATVKGMTQNAMKAMQAAIIDLSRPEGG